MSFGHGGEKKISTVFSQGANGALCLETYRPEMWCQSPRNEWPIGLVTATVPSVDGKIRKIEIKTTSQDKVKTFLRPIPEVVLLLPKEGQRSSMDI